VISLGYNLLESFTFIHLFLELRAYSNVDHDNDPTYRKFVTSFCIFLGDFLISCKSNKQPIVSQFSTKTEYCAIKSTTKEIIWLCWLLAYLRVFHSHPTPIYCNTRLLFRLLTTRFFMNELSTLKSIVILLVIISSIASLLCPLFVLLYRLQISLSSHILFPVFVF